MTETWRIEIVGYGPHNEGKPGDADRLARAFVRVLSESQSVVVAEFSRAPENIRHGLEEDWPSKELPALAKHPG